MNLRTLFHNLRELENLYEEEKRVSRELLSFEYVYAITPKFQSRTSIPELKQQLVDLKSKIRELEEIQLMDPPLSSFYIDP